MKTFKVYSLISEDIKSKLRKFKKLSPQDRKRLADFFSRNNQLEKDVDWDKTDMDITDFQYILHTPSKTKVKKRVKKEGISGLREGVDYIDVSYMFENHNGYVPLNYEASKHIANRYIGRCTGDWCTAYQKNPGYWNSYVVDRRVILVYLVDYEKIDKYAWAVSTNINRWEIFDKNDRSINKIPGENIHLVYKRYKKDLKRIEKKLPKEYAIDISWIKKADVKTPNFHIGEKGTVIWESGIWMVIGEMVFGRMETGSTAHGKMANGCKVHGEMAHGWKANGITVTGLMASGRMVYGITVIGMMEYGMMEDGIMENGMTVSTREAPGMVVFGLMVYGSLAIGTVEHG